MARSIPIEKALDDILVAYGQNGEPIRPEQGYPVRLVVPGWEGNINVKWLHRLHVVDQPAMVRDEDGQLAGYVYVDTATTDIGGYVDQAKRALAEHLKLPAETRLQFVLSTTVTIQP